MGVFGGGNTKKKSSVVTTNQYETETRNFAASDNSVLSGDDVIINTLDGGAVKESFDFAESALNKVGTAVHDVLSFGKDVNYNNQKVIDKAFLFGEESAERADDLSRMSYERSLSTVDKVIDKVIGNQDKLGEHAYKTQQYAMATLAGSKGIDEPVNNDKIIMSVMILAGVIVLATLFKKGK